MDLLAFEATFALWYLQNSSNANIGESHHGDTTRAEALTGSSTGGEWR
jgi:hypothetical protein